MNRKKRYADDRWVAFVIAVVVTAVALGYDIHVERSAAVFTRDFDQFYRVAVSVWHRGNPYDLVLPGGWPFFYPLTAAFVAMPLIGFPLPVARLVFVGATCLLFVYALGRFGGTRWRYATILSKPFQATLLTGQLSFLLGAMVVLPAAAAFACVKPTLGTAIVGARGDLRTVRWALLGGVLLCGLSFALRPTWVVDWFHALRSNPFRGPAVLRSGGFLLLLAALKWRRPEARLLLGLSLVPQTLGMYDALLVFLIPRRPSEYIALVVLSHFAFLLTFNDATLKTTVAFIFAIGNAVVHWLFLPALVMVLMRPNVRPGDVVADGQAHGDATRTDHVTVPA